MPYKDPELQRAYNKRRWQNPQYQADDKRRKQDPGYRARQREAARRYRQRNAEKVCEAGRERYWANRETLLEQNREYRNRPENRERLLAWHRAYYEEHRDELLQKGREYRQRNAETLKAKRRARREATAPLLRERHLDWYARNKDYMRAVNKQRDQRLKTIPAPNRSKRYTQEDINVVLRTDITVTEKAFLLGRSYDSVAHKQQSLRASAERREQQRAKQREYSDRTREQRRQSGRSHYARNRDKVQQRRQTPEAVQMRRDWYIRNRDRINAQRRARRESTCSWEPSK